MSKTTTVSVSSSDETLTGSLALVYTDDAATGSVKYTPVGDENGTADITVTVKDDGLTVNAGADDEIERTFTVTVTSTTAFSYEITTSPATPATGTITAAATVGSVTVESSDTGEIQNLSSGSQITLDSPIAGVDDEWIWCDFPQNMRSLASP